MTSGRPNPAQWLWYALGGRLPRRCRDWVLYDVSGPTWVARHFSRAAVQIAPVALVFLAPGPPWIKGVAVLGGVLMGLFFSLAYIEETCESRAHKHGFPRGLCHQIRRQRAAAKAAAQRERRRTRTSRQPLP